MAAAEIVTLATVETAALAFVLNAAWQIPLAIGLGAALARALRRAPARTVHVLWTLVLAAGVLVPAAGALGSGRPLRPAPPPIASRAGHETAQPGGDAGLAALWERAGRLEVPGSWRPLGAAALLLVVLPAGIGAVSLASAVRRAARLRASARPLVEDDRAVALAGPIGRALRLRGVLLLKTAGPIAPAAVGVLRPAVILPERLLAEASDAELSAVLAHELAHVARRDAARQLLAEFVLLPLRFHPLVRVLRRRLAESREMACDETAAGLLGGPRTYARSLLDVSAIVAGFARPLTLPGVLGAGLLEARMRKLTHGLPSWSPRRAGLALALAGSVLVAANLAASSLAVGMSGPVPGSASSTASARPAPARFAGTWLGLYDEGDGKGLPGALLTVSMVNGEPRASLLMHRHLKKADGSIETHPVGLPILEQRLEDGAIRMRTRDDHFRFKGGPEQSVDLEWRFVLLGEDEGELTVLSNSSFLPAKERGEKVPSPPPPMRMTRHG